MNRTSGTTREHSRRMLKKAVQQGRNFAADPRFTFHASRFTVPGSDARTLLVDFFSILPERLSLTPTRLFEEECALRKGLIASVGDLLGI